MSFDVRSISLQLKTQKNVNQERPKASPYLLYFFACPRFMGRGHAKIVVKNMLEFFIVPIILRSIGQ